MTTCWKKGTYSDWGRKNKELIANVVSTVWEEGNRDALLYTSLFDNTAVLTLATSKQGGKEIGKDDLVMSFMIRGYSKDGKNIVEYRSVYLHPGKYASSVPHLVNAILAIAKSEMKGNTDVIIKVRSKDESLWSQALHYIEAEFCSVSSNKEDDIRKNVLGNIDKLVPLLRHNHRLVTIGIPTFAKLIQKEKVEPGDKSIMLDMINVLIAYVASCDESFVQLITSDNQASIYLEYLNVNNLLSGLSVMPEVNLEGSIEEEQIPYLLLLLNSITSWAFYSDNHS